MEKGVLRNFAKFRGKHLRQSFFFNKVAGLRPQACNFIKKEALTLVFSCEFCEISKNIFFTEHLRTTASALFKEFQLQGNFTLPNNLQFHFLCQV